NLVGTSSTGGSQERREERRQIHVEQSEDPGEKAHRRKPEPDQRFPAPRLRKGGEHGHKEAKISDGDRPAIPERARQPSGKKVPGNARGDDQKEGGAHDLLLLGGDPLGGVR